MLNLLIVDLTSPTCKIFLKWLSRIRLIFTLNAYLLSWHLFVQHQQWKHQENVWNLLKVNNKDTRMTSLMCLYCSLWANKCRMDNSFQTCFFLINVFIEKLHYKYLCTSVPIFFTMWYLKERKSKTKTFHDLWRIAFSIQAEPSFTTNMKLYCLCQ